MRTKNFHRKNTEADFLAFYKLRNLNCASRRQTSRVLKDFIHFLKWLLLQINLVVSRRCFWYDSASPELCWASQSEPLFRLSSFRQSRKRSRFWGRKFDTRCEEMENNTQRKPRFEASKRLSCKDDDDNDDGKGSRKLKASWRKLVTQISQSRTLSCRTGLEPTRLNNDKENREPERTHKVDVLACRTGTCVSRAITRLKRRNVCDNGQYRARIILETGDSRVTFNKLRVVSERLNRGRVPECSSRDSDKYDNYICKYTELQPIITERG